jgi:hypothetical protein
MSQGHWKRVGEECWKLRRGKQVQIPYQWVFAHNRVCEFLTAQELAEQQSQRLRKQRRLRRGLYKLRWPKLVVLLNKVNKKELSQELRESMLDFR